MIDPLIIIMALITFIPGIVSIIFQSKIDSEERDNVIDTNYIITKHLQDKLDSLRDYSFNLETRLDRLSDDTSNNDRLFEKMYNKEVIIRCKYCGSPNTVSNSECNKCGAPL